MFRFVEQGSTSCHENRKSIQRKSRGSGNRKKCWEEGWGGVGVIYDGLASYSRGEGSLQYSQTPCATETEMSFNNSK